MPVINDSDSVGENFSSEASFRNYLAVNLHKFPANPRFIAKEYRIGTGIIDILARSEKDVYVIETKMVPDSDAVLGQLCRYVGWMRHHPQKGYEVIGVVAALHIPDALLVGASVIQNVQLYEFNQRTQDLKLVLCTCVPELSPRLLSADKTRFDASMHCEKGPGTTTLTKVLGLSVDA